MRQLTSLLYNIIGSALSGSCVIAALVLGAETWQSLLTFAAAGAVVAVPVSIVAAKAILARG